MNRNILDYVKNTPRQLLYILIVSMVLHVCGALYVLSVTGAEQLIRGDALIYRELAENLAAGKGFVMQTESGTYSQQTFRVPGFPFLLSLFLRVNASNGISYYLIFISIILAFALPSLTYKIGQMLFNRNVGILTAWLVTLEPLIWIQGWFLLTEAPALISSLAMVLAYIYFIQSAQQRYAVLTGVFAAVTLYIRPQLYPLLLVGGVAIGMYQLYCSRQMLKGIVVVMATCAIALFPWTSHVHNVTGSWALTGMGWINVYKDYLASVRAIENGTDFSFEKESLKQSAMSELHLERHELLNPSYAAWYRARALPELWDKRTTVIKLQTILFFSYFSNTLYYSRLREAGLVTSVPKIGISASKVLAEKGIGGVPEILNALGRVYYIPLIERIWSFSLLLLFVLGFFVSKTPVRYVILLVILIGYITSSVNGLGVEGRFRIPILPLMFMLSAVGLEFLYRILGEKFFYLIRKKAAVQLNEP